jgi:transglycosylase-like protein
VRAVVPIGLATLVCAFPAAAARSGPSASWLAQARCVHLKEGPWTANTGNGYFGGFQFAAKTWRRIGGRRDASFGHPGDPRFPFSPTAAEQLRRAWLLWKADGGSWRSWGAVGTTCSAG